MRLSRGLTCRRAARLPRSPIGPRGWQSRPAPCLAVSLRRNERGPLRAPAPAKASAPAAAGGGGRLSAGREALPAAPSGAGEELRWQAAAAGPPVCSRGGKSASGEGERRGEAVRRGWTGNYQIDVISLCLCLIILNSIAQWGGGVGNKNQNNKTPATTTGKKTNKKTQPKKLQASRCHYTNFS